MPRSRRYRKNQSQIKPEWGKNNPQSKVKNRKRIILLGSITIVTVIIAAFFLIDPNGLFSTPSASPSPPSSPSPSPTPKPTATLSPSVTPLTSPTSQYSSNGTIVLLETSMGNITLQMRDDKPITTSNFVNLIQQGLYDNTIFHRVIEGFMIQGGMNNSINVGTIPDEIGTDNRNTEGTIAMAKTSSPNSATSQFFINVADNGNNIIDQAGARFDDTYTVFGRVIDGMDIVIKISQVTTVPNSLGENSQPQQTITLLRALIVTH